MKYLCLGYRDLPALEALPDSQRHAAQQECAGYAETLRKNGNLLDARVLQPGGGATTVRNENGKVIVKDGPFIETKECLGGFIVLEADDLNHAIQLMSQVPGLNTGGYVEIHRIQDGDAH